MMEAANIKTECIKIKTECNQTDRSDPHFQEAECSFIDKVEVEDTKIMPDFTDSGYLYRDGDVKVENVSPDTEPITPASINGQPEPKLVEMEDISGELSLSAKDSESDDVKHELSENSSEKLHEHIYADGMLYEIREVEERENDTTKNVPIVTDHVSADGESTKEEKTYRCNQCDKTFKLKKELKIHRRNHQMTVCPVCKKSLRTDFVKRHIARMHPNDDVLPKNVLYSCSECERTFPNKVLLTSHQQVHRKQECPVCRKPFRSDYLRRHMDLNHSDEVALPDERQQYPCDQCEAILGNKYQLFFHKRTHQTEDCPICKEPYRTSYLKVHIAMQHPANSAPPENRSFRCDECEVSFSYKTALVIHKRKHRLTECPVCKKIFRFDCLKRHMDIHHADVQPPLDGKQDVTRSKDDSPPDIGTTTYQCDQCEASFGKKSQLSTHKRSHKKIECPICNETFRTNYLKVHIAMKHPTDADASENRSFGCDYCEKSFSYKLELRLHVRKHQLTECPVCNRSMRMDGVKMHMARKHPHHSAEDYPIRYKEQS